MTKMKLLEIIAISALFLPAFVNSGILFPKVTRTRQVLHLDGLWQFSLSTDASFSENNSLSGIENDKDLHLMPVPSSYNDILSTIEGRDHVGAVTYQRTFVVPNTWINDNTRVILRFGSVCLSAQVSVNGQSVANHSIGHLPFETDLTSLLKQNEEYTLTVIVNNNLTSTTIPQGSSVKLPGAMERQSYKFDFFNYAGIDRPVFLYRTPKTYIDDIDVTSTVSGDSATVKYTVKTGGVPEDTSALVYTITILDRERQIVVTKTGVLDDNGVYSDSIDIPNVKLWWPYLMSDEPGYQYTLVVELNQGELVDQYEQLFGVRELTWDADTFKINGKRIYIRGIGRHEDSDIRGKGLDGSTVIRDHNLMRWLGVNCYRTSHYPYAEEIMDLADGLGILIINESPAVVVDHYSNALLENHKLSLTELYKRDKNRPSVIMWSISNEPNTTNPKALQYFINVTNHIKSMDSARPVTLVNFHELGKVVDLFPYLDIVSLNRYQGWYQNTGDIKAIVPELLREINAWRDTYKKPVLLTEYGADAVEGLHNLPTFFWSEEYQLDLMSRYFMVFDELLKQEWFLGEMIWNFADFNTAVDFKRVGGNKKGVFSRQRQPKASAFHLRRRYWSLGKYFDNATVPTDLDRYTFDSGSYINGNL